MAKYCSQLTKEMLMEKYGIKSLSWDEQSHKWIITKDSTKKSPSTICKQHLSTRKHKYSPNKVYEVVCVYDKDTKLMKTLSLARVVWAWFYGVPEGYDVDHKDNNPHNNALENLQLLTRKENIAKRYIDNNINHCNQFTQLYDLDKTVERIINSNDSFDEKLRKIWSLYDLNSKTKINNNKGE